MGQQQSERRDPNQGQGQQGQGQGQRQPDQRIPQDRPQRDDSREQRKQS